MEKVIFVGFVYSEKLMQLAKKWGSSISYSSNTFQSAIIRGLNENGVKCTVLSIPLIDSFPKVKKLYIPGDFTNPNTKVKHFQIGVLNLPIIRLLSRQIGISRALKRELDNDPDNNIVIIYGVTSYTLRAVTKLKKRIKHIHLIAPDLPEYVSGSKNVFYRLGKKIERLSINRSLKKVDSFSLLTEYMKDPLNIKGSPWVLLEGIYDDKRNVADQTKDTLKTVLYSGTLDGRYGIIDLVKAFTLIKDDSYRLWICGDGDSVPFIKKQSEIDNRIEYFGVVNQEKVFELQKKATLLVNPRHSNEEYTKYSFPSKTIEYLASGTPVLMNRLPGIPSEYLDYLYFFETETIEGMKKSIVEYAGLPKEENVRKGKLASDFILKNKNAYQQTKKLLDLILAEL